MLLTPRHMLQVLLVIGVSCERPRWERWRGNAGYDEAWEALTEQERSAKNVEEHASRDATVRAPADTFDTES